MQTWRRLTTTQKVLLGVGVVGGGYLLWRTFRKDEKLEEKPSKLPQADVEEEEEEPPEEPLPPLPDEEEPPPPEGLGGGRGPGVFGGIGNRPRTVARQNFAVSDNSSLPPPVKGSIIDNRDGTFNVRFVHANGFVEYKHHTRQAADLRLDSMVKQPSEWTCEAGYDEAFDAWVCKANVNPGDMVARGFHDTERGPAPWFVRWDGSKYIASFMPDLTSAAEELGQFDEMLAAVQAAAGA